MLASISPLGERARGNRWPVTAGAYLVGSAAGGLAVGLALGGLGLLVAHLHAPLRLGLAVGVALAGAGADGARSLVPLPTVRRQVDEAWLGRYRGWVYGAGFGLQLGAGVATVVTSAATYVALAFALLCGSAVGGATIGVAYGLARAVPLWWVRGVATPGSLRARHRLLHQRARLGHRLAVSGQALAGVVLLTGWLLG